MTHKIVLKEQRAQLVVKEMNNGTKITSEPDAEGWVALEVEIVGSSDVLALYFAGMSAARQADREREEARRAA
jgi:hypothetical protein